MSETQKNVETVTLSSNTKKVPSQEEKSNSKMDDAEAKRRAQAETIFTANKNKEAEIPQAVQNIQRHVSGDIDKILTVSAAQFEAGFSKSSVETQSESLENEIRSHEVGDFSIAQVNQLKPGVKLGEYVIKKVIAKGGIGTAYLAENEENNEQVVVKLIRSDLEFAKQIFEKEINAMKKINHPHVVKIFKEGETNEGLYLVMKYYSGGDLERKSRALARMKRGEIIQWMKNSLPGLIEGILAVHQAGIIHKDIKPHNVLVDEAGRLILADFGLADNEGDEMEEGKFEGTPRFASPEQVSGKVTQMADWFSLGSTLYYLFTGKAVFDGSTNEIINGLNAYRLKQVKIPPVNKINPQIPEPIAAFIMDLLHPNPEERLGDMNVHLDLITAIERLEE